jgi:hypothetical protein
MPADTPRPLPTGLVVEVLFGSFMGQIAWWFVLSGLLFIQVFDAGGAIREWTTFRGQVSVAEGVVLGVQPTNITLNGSTVQETRYRFELSEGRGFAGSSFSSVDTLAAGTVVAVEYVAADPNHSRISGMRTSVGGWVVLFLLGIPLIPAAVIVYDVSRRRRILRLLRNGTLTAGTLAETRHTGALVDHRAIKALFFQFRDAEGVERVVSATTSETERLEDSPHELIVYDPANPRRAFLLDALPAQPRIAPDGSVQATTRGVHPLFYLAAPGLTLLVFALYLVSLI